MIEHQGVLKAYSGRSMERTIGRFKKLIKSKAKAGENAGNILNRFILYGYIKNLGINVEEALELIKPRPYTSNTYISLDPEDSDSPQLWSPLKECDSSSFPCNVTKVLFFQALSKFYSKIGSTNATMSILCEDPIILTAGRAWAYNTVYTSELYKSHISEYRRGNNHIMFQAIHIK